MTKITTGRRRPLVLNGIDFISISAALNTLFDNLTDPLLLSKSRDEQIKIISARLKAGWLPEEAFGFSEPPKQAEKARSKALVCDDVEYKSQAELARAFGIAKKIVHQRISRGWPPEAAVCLTSPPSYASRLGKNTGCIYRWKHSGSGKSYVGMTIDKARREWQHLAAAKSENMAVGSLQHAIAEFGVEMFEFSILEDAVAADVLPARERFWIEELGTLKPGGYNQNRGGAFGGFPTPIEVNGVTYLGVAGVANAFKMSVVKLRRRLDSGWKIEDAVGLSHREMKAPCPVSLNIGEGETEFLSAKSACRYWRLAYSSVEKRRRRGALSWSDAIREAIIYRMQKDMSKTIEINAGGYGRRRGFSSARIRSAVQRESKTNTRRRQVLNQGPRRLRLLE